MDWLVDNLPAFFLGLMIGIAIAVCAVIESAYSEAAARHHAGSYDGRGRLMCDICRELRDGGPKDK